MGMCWTKEAVSLDWERRDWLGGERKNLVHPTRKTNTIPGKQRRALSLNFCCSWLACLLPVLAQCIWLFFPWVTWLQHPPQPMASKRYLSFFQIVRCIDSFFYQIWGVLTIISSNNSVSFLLLVFWHFHSAYIVILECVPSVSQFQFIFPFFLIFPASFCYSCPHNG